MPQGVSDAGAITVKKPAGQKTKFDPNILPPELRTVYDGMLAEFTRKTQDASKIKTDSEAKLAEMQKRVDDLSKNLLYYERLLPEIYKGQVGGEGGEVEDPRANAGAHQRKGSEGVINGETQWNPFDPESARSVAQREIMAYHKTLEKVYNDLVKNIMELQAYNLQLMKVQLIPISQKLGIELVDLNKVIAAAPQYGYNLEQAYRGVYEAPGVYEKGTKGFDTLTKERDSLKQKVADLEAAKAAVPGMLGGTTGPVPRTVAKGQKPKTYAEVAATISPAEVFGSEGGAGAGTGSGTGTGTPQ